MATSRKSHHADFLRQHAKFFGARTDHADSALGIERLVTNHEGRQIANWLNAAGITAFVVKYRWGRGTIIPSNSPRIIESWRVNTLG
jgi:hypothetical protein